MDQKNNILPKWDWIPSNYALRTEIKQKVVTWSLQPTIVLTNPNEDGPDPHVKLYIDTEKSLQYSEELGWNWHKSWNLPNISVRLEIKDSVTGEALLSPKNLYAHLFAVQAVIDQPDNFHLVDVGIRGTNRLELVNGQAFFTAIQFFSTSYNNEGVKFHLVLVIYIMGEDDEAPKVLNATISPPIFVDSRKSARDTQEQKMSSYVEPFIPENLDKPYIKRENQKQNDAEIKIANDIEGLFNYLTAPNIRHQVKHPIFLCLKFSKCVQLFYNTNLLPDQKNEELIETLQRRITKDHCSSKAANGNNSQLDDQYFILYVEECNDNFKTKKITEVFDSVLCPTLGVIYNMASLPPLFDDVCGQNGENLTEISNIYRKNYSNLLNISKTIRNTEIEDYSSQEPDSDESDQQLDRQRKSNKKVKLNPKIAKEKNMFRQGGQKIEENSDESNDNDSDDDENEELDMDEESEEENGEEEEEVESSKKKTAHNNIKSEHIMNLQPIIEKEEEESFQQDSDDDILDNDINNQSNVKQKNQYKDTPLGKRKTRGRGAAPAQNQQQQQHQQNQIINKGYSPSQLHSNQKVISLSDNNGGSMGLHQQNNTHMMDSNMKESGIHSHQNPMTNFKQVPQQNMPSNSSSTQIVMAGNIPNQLNTGAGGQGNNGNLIQNFDMNNIMDSSQFLPGSVIGGGNGPQGGSDDQNEQMNKTMNPQLMKTGFRPNIQQQSQQPSGGIGGGVSGMMKGFQPEYMQNLMAIMEQQNNPLFNYQLHQQQQQHQQMQQMIFMKQQQMMKSGVPGGSGNQIGGGMPFSTGGGNTGGANMGMYMKGIPGMMMGGGGNQGSAPQFMGGMSGNNPMNFMQSNPYSSMMQQGSQMGMNPSFSGQGGFPSYMMGPGGNMGMQGGFGNPMMGFGAQKQFGNMMGNGFMGQNTNPMGGMMSTLQQQMGGLQNQGQNGQPQQQMPQPQQMNQQVMQQQGSNPMGVGMGGPGVLGTGSVGNQENNGMNPRSGLMTGGMNQSNVFGQPTPIWNPNTMGMGMMPPMMPGGMGLMNPGLIDKNNSNKNAPDDQSDGVDNDKVQREVEGNLGN